MLDTVVDKEKRKEMKKIAREIFRRGIVKEKKKKTPMERWDRTLNRLYKVLDRYPFAFLQGGPGTGKGFSVKEVIREKFGEKEPSDHIFGPINAGLGMTKKELNRVLREWAGSSVKGVKVLPVDEANLVV